MKPPPPLSLVHERGQDIPPRRNRYGKNIEGSQFIYLHLVNVCSCIYVYSYVYILSVCVYVYVSFPLFLCVWYVECYYLYMTHLQ